MPRPASLAKDQRSTFIQVRSKSKVYPLQHLYEFLDAQNCWASSRYEYGYIFTIYYLLPVLKYWWFIPYWSFEVKSYDVTEIGFNSYPCSTHTSGWSVWWNWMSERIPIEEQMKEITFRLEYDTTRRLRNLQVVFRTPPKAVRIESTQDNENWEVAQDW